MLQLIDENEMKNGIRYLKLIKSCSTIRRKKYYNPCHIEVKKVVKINENKKISYNIRKGISPHISWLREQVAVKKVIYAKLTDIAKSMGTQFIDMSLNELYIGLRYYLYNENLVVIRSTKYKNIVKMRNRSKVDRLPLWIKDKMKIVHYNEDVLEAMRKNGEISWDGDIIITKNIIHIKDGICPHCNQTISQTNHHIIPRKYNGPDTEENYIDLCIKCHDYVEIKTEEWIESGKYYNINILRSMIINDGF